MLGRAARRLRRGRSTTPRSPAEASRDWWPLGDDLGARRARSPPRAAVVARPTDADAGRRGARRSATRPASRSPPPPAVSGVCGALGPAPRRRRARPLRAVGHPLGRRRRRWSSTSLPGTFGDRFEDELRAEHGLTVGHWPQSMTLSTVGGWLACRGAGQLSTRYGKIEDMVVGLDVVLADGRTHPHRRRSPRRRPGPTSPSCSSAPRAPSGSSPAPGCACTRRRPTSAGRRLAFAVVRRRPRRLPPRSCAGRHARGAAPLRRDRVATATTRRGTDRHVLLVLDEGDPARRRRGDRDRRARSAPTGRGERLDDALVEHWLAQPQRRRRPRGADRRRASWSTRWRSPAPGPTLPGDLRRRRSTPSAPSTARSPSSAHQSHTYLDGGLPLLHLRRQAAERDARTATEATTLLPRLRGTPAPGPCSPTAARSATTTASA